jgi:hypothetical protein
VRSFDRRAPLLLPIAAEGCRSQLAYGLRPVYGPAPPRAFQSVLEQGATSPVGSPAAQGEPARERLVGAHDGFVHEEGVSGRVPRLAVLPTQLELGDVLRFL